MDRRDELIEALQAEVSRLKALVLEQPKELAAFIRWKHRDTLDKLKNR